MVVILSVLKFLLLFVALLFLLFVLLLLFFLLYPVSYSFQGDKEKEKNPNASFHLRFPGVHLLISYQNRKIRYSGKILFFTVWKGGEE